MAQLVKIEKKIPMRSHTDKFYGFLKNNLKIMTQMFPDSVKSIEIAGGGKAIKTGSVVHAKYCVAGSPVLSAKVKVEALDDARKTITFKIIEGDVISTLYKNFKVKVEIGSSYVKWSIECEKASAGSPNPDDHLELAAKVTKGMDAYYSQ